jgi:hypothetical protein
MSGPIPPFPQHAFMARCTLKKHSENFTFTIMTTIIFKRKGRGKAVPAHLLINHAMKAYLGSGGIAPRILDLGA